MCYKNPADVLIKGYNIYFLTDLEELNKKIYTETVFDQIWYIRSGLTHADLIKVAEKYANQKYYRLGTGKHYKRNYKEGTGYESGRYADYRDTGT